MSKGRDGVIQEELYAGTSKSAEGYAARATFGIAKEEGMQVAVHWQDADSSSANAVAEVFPDAEIITCGGHAGRAHRKQLEVRAKQKVFSKALIARYEKQFPEVRTVTCHCPGNHTLSLSHPVRDATTSRSWWVRLYTWFFTHILCSVSSASEAKDTTMLSEHKVKLQSQCSAIAGSLVRLRCFSSSEVIPLTTCASIPLDKWRQAPKVSLRSLTRDPAIAEHCDCNLTLCSESIVVSSASEAEDTEHNMWVKNHVYSLTHHDREVVASRTGWLNDNVIAAAQMLMLQYFPNMAGLQPLSLKKVFAFQVHSGEFVPIINVKNKHWCVVSTVGCDNGVVEVYDSLCTSIPVKTVRLIASLVCSTVSKLDIRMRDVASQSNDSLCTSIPVKTVRLIASLVCSTVSKLDIRMRDVASQSKTSLTVVF